MGRALECTSNKCLLESDLALQNECVNLLRVKLRFHFGIYPSFECGRARKLT